MPQKDNLEKDDQLRHLEVVSRQLKEGTITSELTVVAFLALGTVTRHVTEATASVACLAAATTSPSSVAVSAPVASSTAISTAPALSAVACNVTNLAALVTFLAAAAATATGVAATTRIATTTTTTAPSTATTALARFLVGAFTGNMAFLTTSVAGFRFGSSCAFTRDVTFTATVVADWVALLRAVTSLMRSVAA
jgi:hypothetical protein